MNLRQIVEIADKGYADDTDNEGKPQTPTVSLLYHIDADGNVLPAVNGDTLALFVVRELSETYDPDATDEEQLQEAARALEAAAEQLELAAGFLEAHLSKLETDKLVEDMNAPKKK